MEEVMVYESREAMVMVGLSRRMREEQDRDGRQRETGAMEEEEPASDREVLGGDARGGVFRLLVISRSQKQLVIREERETFDRDACRERIERLLNLPGLVGLKKVMGCYGVLGFVKFVDLYYMAVIEKRRLVGDICGHEVFAVEQVRYLPISAVSLGAEVKRKEEKYLRYMSENDVMKDCFFSCSYDLTKTLQTNLGGLPYACSRVAGEASKMFTWNHQLLEGGGFLSMLHHKPWATRLIHGFFEQRTVVIVSRQMRLTLIARRSRCFAGTRYLKRGATLDGFVANEVETEQIVCEQGFTSRLSCSSYVQVRGSVPLFWSQVTDAMVPKPDIELHRFDCMYHATAAHFSSLLERYGRPVHAVDLVKQTEKKPRETKLGDELANAIRVLQEGYAGTDAQKKGGPSGTGAQAKLKSIMVSINSHLLPLRARDCDQDRRDLSFISSRSADSARRSTESMGSEVQTGASEKSSHGSVLRFLTPVLAPFMTSSPSVEPLSSMKEDEEEADKKAPSRSRGALGKYDWLYSPQGAQVKVCSSQQVAQLVQLPEDLPDLFASSPRSRSKRRSSRSFQQLLQQLVDVPADRNYTNYLDLQSAVDAKTSQQEERLSCFCHLPQTSLYAFTREEGPEVSSSPPLSPYSSAFIQVDVYRRYARPARVLGLEEEEERSKSMANDKFGSLETWVLVDDK
ncbi:hypothetical protein GUITHDRAFT_112093 [Guillardia theta CCMP2712]|uniref:SAC domain-containing protein n=1 Tax=Guillardia theta (strain CCMP2712) TaxID=905079 RepID=L1J0D4_GUITC|nr:hypothetical protein GUITHDRAFT_112093 [Guillardia theta CCMP2712]EKX41961.1 hypothetical protein GUITHDRAFT_112093 [Guillardia theta CCMP2712]|eukprot:XP_005828941.1 hypothetical protein GUITHDRAFT_112093 [Guillardia theta CCMP2712]